MVKSLLSISLAFLLLIGAALFERRFVVRQFAEFGQEVNALCEKTEAETACGGDAEAVQRSWEARKQRLQILIPHNDVARIDDYLAESRAFIEQKEYALAFATLKILVVLSGTLPNAYRPNAENIL